MMKNSTCLQSKMDMNIEQKYEKEQKIDKNDNKILLCIVSSEIDFILTQSSTCIKCLERKLKTIIYKTYPLSTSDVTFWKKNGIRGIITECLCKYKFNLLY